MVFLLYDIGDRGYWLFNRTIENGIKEIIRAFDEKNNKSQR